MSHTHVSGHINESGLLNSSDKESDDLEKPGVKSNQGAVLIEELNRRRNAETISQEEDQYTTHETLLHPWQPSDTTMQTLSYNSTSTLDGRVEPNGPSYCEGIHWQKGAEIGRGAYATCFLARDNTTGSEMAVKELDQLKGPQYQAGAKNDLETAKKKVREFTNKRGEYETEVNILANLHHTNVLQFKCVARQDWTLFIFTEYLPGGSVEQALKMNPAAVQRRALSLLQQLFEGLKYLQENHIAHRDIKSGNLLLDRPVVNSDDVRLVIADFGMAQLVKNGQLPRPPEAVGTAPYLAPEMAREEEHGMQADTWSAGVVGYEMYTGHLPWSNTLTNISQYIWKYGMNEIPPLSGIPNPMLRILQGCFVPDPKKRPLAAAILQLFPTDMANLHG